MPVKPENHFYKNSLFLEDLYIKVSGEGELTFMRYFNVVGIGPLRERDHW
jgi:hypothetical protein